MEGIKDASQDCDRCKILRAHLEQAHGRLWTIQILAGRDIDAGKASDNALEIWRLAAECRKWATGHMRNEGK